MTPSLIQNRYFLLSHVPTYDLMITTVLWSQLIYWSNIWSVWSNNTKLSTLCIHFYRSKAILLLVKHIMMFNQQSRKFELHVLLLNIISFMHATSVPFSNPLTEWAHRSSLIPFVLVTSIIHFDIPKDEMKESSKLLM